MTCTRCNGNLFEERVYDLPKHLREFCCINCGERFWFDLSLVRLSWGKKLFCIYPN